MQPLVTVICLCFNHARFLKEALNSVLNQTYPNLEIIVADDFSSDNSREIIEEYVQLHPQLKFLKPEKNLGNCAAFNRALALSKGEYIIDFATDDVLLPNRIENQVKAFSKLDENYGVLFTDAEFIADNGNSLGNFYKRNPDGSLKETVPNGDVFAEVLRRHYICTPTMIMRRSVFEALDGYDESLAYEDFDFWVRSARTFKYFFLDDVTTKRRIHPHQLSQKQYKPNDKQIFSTITVCRKAQKLVKSEAEKEALITRVQYELTQAIFTDNREAARQYYELLQELTEPTLKLKALVALSKTPVPLSWVRNVYRRFQGFN